MKGQSPPKKDSFFPSTFFEIRGPTEKERWVGDGNAVLPENNRTGGRKYSTIFPDNINNEPINLVSDGPK
jgi:hypothetical protein